eukprot:9491333-Pyramimonas_sp.AAC.1
MTASLQAEVARPLRRVSTSVKTARARVRGVANSLEVSSRPLNVAGDLQSCCPLAKIAKAP